MSFFGLQKIHSIEKIKGFLNWYTKNNPEDEKGYTIIKLILDELNIASWNLSTSFINKGVMTLKGNGDPTNGNGGYSFIKRPFIERY